MITPNWVSKCGTVELYNRDCREVIRSLDSVDAVITDPPYGDKETHDSHLSKITLRNGEQAGKQLGFSGITCEEMMAIATEWTEKAKRWCVFTCEWKFVAALDSNGLLVRFGIWRKPDGAPQFTGDRPGTGWEAVAICHRPGRKRWNGGGRHAFWNYPKGQNNSGHPTGKPLGLFVDFVKDFTDEGETVLDPFMGSGTTGLACVRHSRRFIGCEIDPVYFDLAKIRIAEALESTALFDRASKPKAARQTSLFADANPP
jgi:site-specific DNA-methyltransferase (adenine-specific)